MVFCHWLALAALLGSPQDTRPLPGAAPVSAGIAARLERADMARDGFAHEQLSTALAERLAEALPEPGEAAPNAAGLAALLASEVELGADLGAAPPSAPRVVANEAPLATAVTAGTAPVKVARADAAARLAAELASLPGTGAWKKKVLRTERLASDRLAMRVLLSPRPLPRDGGGLTHGRLVLALEWMLEAAAPDESSERWSLVRCERSAREVTEAAAGLEDVTAAVLAPSPRSREQLVPSIGALGLRLDAALGVGFLGHHGVAVGDINGDGLDDVYLCQPGGMPDQLWLQRADGTAVDVAPELGLDLLDSTRSALFVDLDNDGDQDLVRATGLELLVHVNRGGGRIPVAFALAVADVTSLAAADIDLDGRVDLFACTYGSPYTGDGMPVPYHDARNGTPNVLLANRSTAADTLAFEDVTEAAGMGGADQRFSFAASFADFDGDGDADLYVANDFGRNQLWRNERSAETPLRFVDVAAELGVEDVAAGMGVTWADFDLDGQSDLYVSNMFSSAGNRIAYDRNFHASAPRETLELYRRHAEGNSLFLQRAGAFEFTGAANLGLWAWGGLAFELDGDGRPDLYVPNGFITGTNPDDL